MRQSTISKTVRIPTGGSGLSLPVAIEGYRLVALQVPNDWTAADLTFRARASRYDSPNQVLPTGTAAGLGPDAAAADIQMANAIELFINGFLKAPAKVDPIDVSALLDAATVGTSKYGVLWVFQNADGTADVEVDKTAADYTSLIQALGQYSKPTRTLPPSDGMIPIGCVVVLEGGSGEFTWGTDSIAAEGETYYNFAGLPEILIPAASLALNAGAATFVYGAVTFRLGTGVRVAATGKTGVTIGGSNVADGKTGAWLIYGLADDVEYALQLGNAYPTLADAQNAVAVHTKNPMLALVGAMYVQNASGGNFVPGTTNLDATDVTTTFETFGPTHSDLYDDAGDEVTVAVAADQYVVLGSQAIEGVASLQLRSGTSATPVDQTSSPDLTLILEGAL